MAYLDHAATTPMRPEAVAAMLPFLTEHFGNPSGAHAVARRAKEALEDARDEVAAALGCDPNEVVFTSGGTEADNLAVAGVVSRHGGRPVCPATEHHAVLRTVEALGGEVVGVDAGGVVDLDRLRSVVAAGGVTIASVMAANNETGVVTPLADVVAVVRSASSDVRLHCDAVQAFPWLDVARLTAEVDLVAVSAHKFGGPKGVGVLVVRKGTTIAPSVHGGGQEQERRSGTHNVAGIVGMAAAMTATVAAREVDAARVAGQRDRLLDAIRSGVPAAVETGARRRKVAGNAHLRFPGIENESLLVLLDDAGVAASAGSACASGALEPSHVLAAMGVPATEARGSLRLSLGPTTTDDDVDVAAKAVVESVRRLQGTAQR